jgi:RuvB-like protein 2
MQLLITSHLIAAKRKSSTVELPDLERAFKLFLDQNRSVQYLQSNENEFISGREWDNVNGEDGSAPMQDVQA